MSFKIYEKPDSKRVLIKDNFSTFTKYVDIKKKVLDSTRNNKNLNLSEKNKFILAYMQEKEQNRRPQFIPDDLKEGIWDNKTFLYLKEKLTLRGIKDAQYKFYIKKVDKLPTWNKKLNQEFLAQALDDSCKSIYDDIMDEVSLNKLEASKIEYNKKKSQLEKNQKEVNKEIHKNVICNNCLKDNFKGKRFICAECNSYNLCQDCEKLFYQKQIHNREHTLIQVNKSISEDNLYKYSNIIGNNDEEFKDVPSSFQIELNIINNGENNLKGCYFLPIRYGEDYLSCRPKQIDEDVERNMKVKLFPIIRLPHENTGYFEGYFRLFTPEGFPFGDVFHMTVLNGE